MRFLEYLEEADRLTGEMLTRVISDSPTTPKRLSEAMLYSLFSGGKRLRPAMVLFAAELCGYSPRPVGAAAAIEMVHTYSLIHDDLPAMDDDDTRRGRPSLHRAFDEATAILAGDALLTLAFETLASGDGVPKAAETRLELCRILSTAAGRDGMIAGQVIDMQGSPYTPAGEISLMHELKTARLFRAALLMGACCASADSDTIARLDGFAAHFGRLYQAADDLEDYVAQKSDVSRSSLVQALGLSRTREYLHTEMEQALLSIEGLSNAWWLRELCNYVSEKADRC